MGHLITTVSDWLYLAPMTHTTHQDHHREAKCSSQQQQQRVREESISLPMSLDSPVSSPILTRKTPRVSAAQSDENSRSALRLPSPQPSTLQPFPQFTCSLVFVVSGWQQCLCDQYSVHPQQVAQHAEHPSSGITLHAARLLSVPALNGQPMHRRPCDIKLLLLLSPPEHGSTRLKGR